MILCQKLLCAGGARPLWEKPLPGLLDVFGWCTWDAFYSRVSARGERHCVTSPGHSTFPAQDTPINVRN